MALTLKTSSENNLLDFSRIRTSSLLAVDQAIDEELQAIVTQASQETDFPIALLSLVLKNVQFFKAFVGLPPSLAISRASDRCSSFCQFVVREGEPLWIADAAKEPWLPQDMIKEYGISAYFGVPLRVQGHVVGSLCVIDVKIHPLSDALKTRMIELGQKASARLETIYRGLTRPGRLASVATRPALGQMKNTLAAYWLKLEHIEGALTEFEPFFNIASAAKVGTLDPLATYQSLKALPDTCDTRSELRTAVNELKRDTQVLVQQMLSLDTVVRDDVTETSDAFASVQSAIRLSTHMVKLVGGARFEPPAQPLRLSTNNAILVSTLSSALNLISEQIIDSRATAAGIQISFDVKESNLHLKFSTPSLAPSHWACIASILSLLGEGTESFSVHPVGDGVRFEVPLVRDNLSYRE